jgi:hypothetical protein
VIAGVVHRERHSLQRNRELHIRTRALVIRGAFLAKEIDDLSSVIIDLSVL